MLVFTRKKNETIRIGDNIVITLVGSGDRVKIGIDAPKDMPVHRGEVYESIKLENSRAPVTV